MLRQLYIWRTCPISPSVPMVYWSGNSPAVFCCLFDDSSSSIGRPGVAERVLGVDLAVIKAPLFVLNVCPSSSISTSFPAQLLGDTYASVTIVPVICIVIMW